MESHEQPADAEEPVIGPDDDVNEDKQRESDFEHFGLAFDRERLRLGSTTETVLAALLEAGPDAVEHLLKAAQELLLAAKEVVDAGERAVESHRAATGAAVRGPDAPHRDARVRRIDLA